MIHVAFRPDYWGVRGPLALSLGINLRGEGAEIRRFAQRDRMIKNSYCCRICMQMGMNRIAPCNRYAFMQPVREKCTNCSDYRARWALLRNALLSFIQLLHTGQHRQIFQTERKEIDVLQINNKILVEVLVLPVTNRYRPPQWIFRNPETSSGSVVCGFPHLWETLKGH